jgi:putative tryptophan/tyrosine transport system substrate-binding protein
MAMKRRAFIAALGGAAAWPLVARAQQPRMSRIGILVGGDEGDSAIQTRVAAFENGLHDLGWIDGRNVRFDLRFAAADPERTRTLAEELVARAPDVILAHTTIATAALLQQTHTIPIVFVAVSDPEGSGFVASLAQPDGNVTGFINIEAKLVEKTVEVLKEIAPATKRAAIMFNPLTVPQANYYLRPFEAAARSLGVEPITAPVHDDAEIERVIADLAREPGGGLVLLTDIFIWVHREAINRLAARYQVPTTNTERSITADGGLATYGVDNIDLFRRAASYADRILKGSKPSELPVQAPTKFDLLINLKTAKALGLEVPPQLLARADEVIE